MSVIAWILVVWLAASVLVGFGYALGAAMHDCGDDCGHRPRKGEG